jgi:hypothetical protein
VLLAIGLVVAFVVFLIMKWRSDSPRARSRPVTFSARVETRSFQGLTPLANNGRPSGAENRKLPA